MAWESRAGTANTYYTRCKRVAGKVVREYLGNGPAAEEAARQDEEQRRGREQQRRRKAEIASRFAAAEEACEQHYQFVELVFQAVMEENGYHYHRGQWRKRRVSNQPPPSEDSGGGSQSSDQCQTDEDRNLEAAGQRGRSASCGRPCATIRR